MSSGATQERTQPTGTDAQPVQVSSLHSVHTKSFAEILNSQGISVAVTTYQAGKLVLLRSEASGDGPVVNTHFRNFNKPMGLACERGRFALGTNSEIWEFHDIPAVAQKLERPDRSAPNDAVFLPRNCHMTGDVQIHEMVWQPAAAAKVQSASGLSELWFVNTRFSCLCTRSEQFSFAVRWRPPFISALAPEDRCHLNGVCLRDDVVRYATALGETDAPHGWRGKKSSGGIVIDVSSGEVVARSLSMPHSPRWHAGRLWVLDSGNGGLGVIEPGTGRYEEVCRLPGFTRGLSFSGPFAFVGLSQVRETSVFSGIAVAETPRSERFCGVWAIDVRTGRIAGFVKFTDGVQEIFSVQTLGMRLPEVLNDDAKRIAETYELPQEALAHVPPSLRQLSGELEKART